MRDFGTNGLQPPISLDIKQSERPGPMTDIQYPVVNGFIGTPAQQRELARLERCVIVAADSWYLVDASWRSAPAVQDLVQSVLAMRGHLATVRETWESRCKRCNGTGEVPNVLFGVSGQPKAVPCDNQDCPGKIP